METWAANHPVNVTSSLEAWTAFPAFQWPSISAPNFSMRAALPHGMAAVGKPQAIFVLLASKKECWKNAGTMRGQLQKVDLITVDKIGIETITDVSRSEFPNYIEI